MKVKYIEYSYCKCTLPWSYLLKYNLLDINSSCQWLHYYSLYAKHCLRFSFILYIAFNIYNFSCACIWQLLNIILKNLFIFNRLKTSHVLQISACENLTEYIGLYMSHVRFNTLNHIEETLECKMVIFTKVFNFFKFTLLSER